ncbi:MAG: hypothetical protein JW395_4124 [Nitrospira sp.]|nr:hypothetical protein [Nitrospira sp.]
MRALNPESRIPSLVSRIPNFESHLSRLFRAGGLFSLLLGPEKPLRPNQLLFLLRLGSKGFVQAVKVGPHKSTRDGTFYRGSKTAYLIG